MHALIVGTRGAGKSTLIRRVLNGLDKPVFGFETRKEDGLADEIRGSPVYIYEAGKPHLQSGENLVGYCLNQRPENDKAAFDRFAPKLLAPVPDGVVIVMDELGFMESASKAFCDAVMSVLDGSAPVIAAVKDKDVPFLNAVQSHRNCKCLYISPENRDALCSEVLAFLRNQI